uniref:Uncharacterized protein n=1 Tax=viral metagenome TaxID=1070528 RepID=A0A6M3LWM4_9ZZZZ
MKKFDRKIYIVLADEVDCALCVFCQYSQSEGWCEESYPVCTHPLEYRLPVYDEELTPGDDCWCFRNELPLDDIADIVGIIKANKFSYWGWQKDKDQIKVYGKV